MTKFHQCTTFVCSRNICRGEKKTFSEIYCHYLLLFDGPPIPHDYGADLNHSDIVEYHKSIMILVKNISFYGPQKKRWVNTTCFSFFFFLCIYCSVLLNQWIDIFFNKGSFSSFDHWSSWPCPQSRILFCFNLSVDLNWFGSGIHQTELSGFPLEWRKG